MACPVGLHAHTSAPDLLGSPPILGSRPRLHQADHRQRSQALTGGTVAPREHVCLGGGWKKTMEHSSLH